MLDGLASETCGVNADRGPHGLQETTAVHVHANWRMMVPDSEVTQRQEELERSFWEIPSVAEAEAARYAPVRHKLSRAMLEDHGIIDPAALDSSHGGIHDFDFIPTDPPTLSYKQVK